MSVYKGDKIVADGCVNVDYIRNLHDPDWSQAVIVTAQVLWYGGYTAPKNGVFVGSMVPINTTDDPLSRRGIMCIKLNGVKIGYGLLYAGSEIDGSFAYNDIRPASINVIASKGDVLKSDTLGQNDVRYQIYFVPYKAQ